MLRLAPLLAVLVLVGCADPDTPTTSPTSSASGTASGVSDTTEADVAARPERPATIEETISIEGMDETVTLTLVSFPDLRLPFSTYVREGWTSEESASDEGEAAMLTFGASSVHLFIPAGSSSVEEVLRLAGTVAESYGNAVPLEPENWSQGGFAFSDTDLAGQVRVGSHAEVPFYVIETYAHEMGDGFGPAARVITDRWRWTDDGMGL